MIMKNIFMLAVSFLAISCKGQDENPAITVSSSDVKEITIQNKVYCSMHNLSTKSIIITDVEKIKKILKVFSNSNKIEGNINSRANNGFFEISFNEKAVNHYYTINYTVYDGVVLRNDNNGKLYKNDELEGIIYTLFVIN